VQRAEGRAANVAPGPPGHCRQAGGLQQARSAPRRLLWGLLPLAQPLTHPLPPSLARLAERLARHQPVEAAELDRRWAAVALILAPDPDSILLIRRAERAGDPWSGQIGLPGGRRGANDADLVATAVREAAEEVGIDLTPAHRLGALSDVVPSTPVLPPIAVRPFVFGLSGRAGIRPNAEVASAHWIEVADLGRPHVRRPTTVTIRGEALVVPAFMVDELVVWGMTERILDSFLQAIS
jgi:8-oxo-dGTP pyrophosphatase MutT (NUDIX family)